MREKCYKRGRIFTIRFGFFTGVSITQNVRENENLLDLEKNFAKTSFFGNLWLGRFLFFSFYNIQNSYF